MAAPQQQGGGGGDNSLAAFWIVMAIFIFGWALWSFAHAHIVAFIFEIRLLEVKLISLFSHDVLKVGSTIKSTAPENVSFDQLADISSQIGDYLRYPTAIILGVLALAIYFGHANLQFKKSYNMQRLVDEEKVNWPQITPTSKLDLVSADIDVGPWAMSLTPMQFAKKYNLLQLERVLPSDAFSSQQAKVVATLRREEAYQIFALQLGRYWVDTNSLNIHTKALFAVFAARASRDREGATNLLLQIAASAASGKLDFSGAEELLKKHKDNKAVIKTIQNHAFIYTVMASLLVLARTDGVLATADFLWLKPIDRSLWFMLNSVGRQTPFSEVAGPFSHWIAERTIGHKLNVPMVDEAVKALEIAIQDVVYVPDEDEQV